MENWHVPELNILEKKLNTNIADGLSAREARVRLERLNKKSGGRVKSLFVQKKRSPFLSLLHFFGSPTTILLLLISIMAAIFGRGILGWSVFVLALTGVIFGGIV